MVSGGVLSCSFSKECAGKPIFEWPKVTITTNVVPFEDEERLLYNTVMTRYADEFARMDAKGELVKKQGFKKKIFFLGGAHVCLSRMHLCFHYASSTAVLASAVVCFWKTPLVQRC